MPPRLAHVTAVSASISTPVRAVARTTASMATQSGSGNVSVTSTESIGNGWHSGTMSLVRLAAMMPASRAVAMASPLSSSRAWMRRIVSGRARRRAEARAVRSETGLEPTSIIRMPWGVVMEEHTALFPLWQHVFNSLDSRHRQDGILPPRNAQGPACLRHAGPRLWGWTLPAGV
jgi:hypothetical protein